MDPLYGYIQLFAVGKTTYQMQSVKDEGSTHYLISRGGEFLCKVYLNSKGHAVSDCDISQKLLHEIARLIEFYTKEVPG